VPPPFCPPNSVGGTKIGRVAATVDRMTRLRDGRAIGWAEIGDATGFAVLSAHGGLSCRLDAEAATTAATRCGVRLISPDRPGIGLSDVQPGRTLSDWAADIAELLDQLEVERCAVMGWSMGGQYAAAVGHALPARVVKVAIVAGALPLCEPGVFTQLPLMDRVYTRLSQHAPLLARAGFRSMNLAARCAPGLYGRAAAHALGPADATILRREGYAGFARMSVEALRRPKGVVEDYRAWMRPWGFRPEDLTVAVDVWAGADDELVNREWPQRLAQRIPGAELHVRSGGHFVAHLHYQEIFEGLLAR
jgi:pimeloyl-ACP methyl ester carboxylesterase